MGLTGNGSAVADIQTQGLIDARDTGGADVSAVDEGEGVDCGEDGDGTEIDFASACGVSEMKMQGQVRRDWGRCRVERT